MKLIFSIFKYIMSKLATIVEGNQKAPFSIATTPRCRGGCYSFPWIAPLYPWYVAYFAVLSKEVSSTIFNVFGMTRPGIERKSPKPLANTLPTRPIVLNNVIKFLEQWFWEWIKKISGLFKTIQGCYYYHYCYNN